MGARGPSPRLSARQNARLRERLLDLAEREGLSERALARKAGVSVGAVRSVGGTVAGPTLGTLLALAKALQLQSVDQLLGPSALATIAAHDLLEGEIGEVAMTVVMGIDTRQ